MSIFDYFASKAADEQDRKSVSPNPNKKLLSELDAAGEEVKAQYPDDSKLMDDFVKVLKKAYKLRSKKAPDGTLPPMQAEAHFSLSSDRMRAYACLLPPENGGGGISLEEFLEGMHYEGICYGILQEEIRQELGRGYFRVFPVARGEFPKAGEDGKVTELFQRRKNMHLEVQDESQVDFSQDVQLQPIRKGAVICLIRPSRAGTDGMDVTGKTLPCPPGISVHIPQGENTAITRGGQALTASADGLLYIEDDQFCIHAQKIIDGDLDQFQGMLQISGNLYIGGNVDGEVDIEAFGDIVINGKVGQARVRSLNGTIRIQQGVYGTEGKTFITAARQVQSPVLEGAEVHAGISVITEVISNSTIYCHGIVYAMTGRGMITSSLIQAESSILCRRIGNLAGGRSRFSVGYPLHSAESWKRVKSELAEVEPTIKKLWAAITDLKKKGNRISDTEKSVLDQLLEQRNLYIERRDALTAEMKSLNKVLDKRANGKIQCAQLFPVLEVQIGRLSEEITEAHENCNIHVGDNQIIFK